MRTHSLAIPIAIIIAAALIGGALFFTGEKEPLSTIVPEKESAETSIRPVDNTDHILGNPNAPIILVEYSDFDCPYCKQFHETMTRIITEYGANGQVAWVYRHFPLTQLHPNAALLAEASECIAELGGNDAFWTFTDTIFAERALSEQTNVARLPEFAENAGVEKDAFEACVASERHAGRVAEDAQEAVTSGGKGTPHTIVLAGNQQGLISGAQPYASVKQIIDSLLAQMDGR